ncbi:hypothetical protein ACVWYG_003353, partial [Pedobacter sp. UYEF25]
RRPQTEPQTSFNRVTDCRDILSARKEHKRLE